MNLWSLPQAATGSAGYPKQSFAAFGGDYTAVKTLTIRQNCHPHGAKSGCASGDLPRHAHARTLR